MTKHNLPAHHTRPYKILSQSIGLMVCLFLAFFILGEGILSIIKGSGSNQTLFLLLFAVPVASYIITWFAEGLGASGMLGGGVLLLLFFMQRGDTNMALLFGLPFIVAGLLFMLHIRKRNELKARMEKQEPSKNTR